MQMFIGWAGKTCACVPTYKCGPVSLSSLSGVICITAGRKYNAPVSQSDERQNFRLVKISHRP